MSDTPARQTLVAAHWAPVQAPVQAIVLLICMAVPQARTAWSEDATAASEPTPTAEQLEFFETKIRPLLANHCYECHGADEQESGLRVDTLAGLLGGGHAGPSLVPGKPESSLLVTAMSYRDSDLQMPPTEKLSDSELADVTRWVQMGAPHPDSGQTLAIQRHGEIDLDAGRQHWAFQPVVEPVPPPVDARAAGDRAAGNFIDAFIRDRLEAAGLRQAPAADKTTLIRRATFDLIGLPPTPAEIDAFLADDSAGAFARLIDRLLASPHYGERWARHWLDVARYADSNGLDENVAHGNAWRYRDYVVRAFNDDKPYDQFVVEQLAGDLLDSGSDVTLRNERLIATGFLVLGPKVLAEQDQAKMEMDIIDEQIDTIGRSIMGLTLGCARCHTHKFDPISHRDYYALAGIFKSTRTMDSYATIAKWHENPIETPAQAAQQQQYERSVAEKQQQIDQAVAAATATLDAAVQEQAIEEREKLFPPETQAELKQLREELKQLQDAAPERPMAMGVVDGEVADTAVHLRGSHLTLGEVVPRRFPEVLVEAEPPSLPADRSGRLEFARWLTSGTHPLTARVMVNRIWRGHFGTGLVATVDNFGVQGQTPSHPELLDWLAAQFVKSGWSIKAMHRTIMLSQTYQAGSDFDAAASQADPGNRLYWRYNLRRLEAEAIRDALLAVSGKLDRTAGGNLMQYKNREHVFDHTSKDKSTYDAWRRSLYLPVIRNHLYDMFQLFDYTDASVLAGDRNTSTTAPQALFLMNSELIAELSLAIADRMLQGDATREERIDQLYREAFGRTARSDERAAAAAFLSQFQSLPDSQPDADSQPDVDDSQRRAWQALCQAVVSSSEFVYLR